TAGSSTRVAVAACLRTIARPRGFTSSPPIREMRPRNTISGSSTRVAVAACRRTIARARGFTNSPPTREMRPRNTISGSSTRVAVAACRRTIARPRASSSSPPTREMRPRNVISGTFTSRAVAACRRTIARPHAFTNSPPTRKTPRRSAISGTCMLVLIGATPEGKKELIGFQTGMRESAQSWKELLVDLKARGLSIAPEVAVGDGALGFWEALDETFPARRQHRCWLQKTLNVLDKFPKSVQPNARKPPREIWLAPDRATAETAIAAFAEKYAPKYDKAVECMIKDHETLLTFFDFPADHWVHLRTTNPIESVFATVRHRTVRMKGALSH